MQWFSTIALWSRPLKFLPPRSHVVTVFFVEHFPLSLPSFFSYRATPIPANYVYPDSIPEFAVVETHKFKEQLSQNLAKDRETFGNDLDSVVEVCSKIFGEYLHVEYGGPGTLLVEPFTNMFIALNERNTRSAFGYKNFAPMGSKQFRSELEHLELERGELK